jgi:hypothetical protein
MPATFSASTCISSTNTSNGPFNIYLNGDYTSTPFSSATLVQLTTCPYVIVVPTGTTSLGFKDTIDNFCFDTIIQNNDICSNCNLGLSNYSATTITKLSCGILTGTCNNINDYVINWYGPNNTTTLAFTSGAGSFLTPNMIPHPFTGITSVPQPEGVYTPVISKIKLSGITFSNTGGTNNVLFSGSCLPTTTIQALTCSNQTNFTGLFTGYNHFIEYEFLNAVTPQPITLTYKISTTTKFFAWRFSGSAAPDRIQIKFSGSSYGGNEFGLEDFVVGSNLLSNNFSATTFPKSASTYDWLVKPTCLTGFTVNNNDNIIITITPAASDTKWSLYSTCLTNFDCSTCLLTNPYKIIGSTITGTSDGCATILKFSISGCNTTSYNSTDFAKYYESPNGPNNYQRLFTESGTNSSLDYPYKNPLNYITPKLFINQNVCTQSSIYYSPASCVQGTNDVKYEKTFVGGIGSKGIFNITGSSTVISTYYNSWLFLKTNYSGSTSSTDATYYRHFRFFIPAFLTSNNCQESFTSIQVTFHPSSPVATGLTSSGSYYFKLTAETISNNFSALTNCDIDCKSLTDLYVKTINDWSTGNTTDYGAFTKEFVYNPSVNSFGVYYQNPFYNCASVFKNNTTTSGTSAAAGYYTNVWTTNTIPYSGVSNTLIPSFSGTLCNYNTLGTQITDWNSFFNKNYLFYYYSRIYNLNDFEIWSAPIVNYSANTNSNDAILVYRYSGGNVTFSSSTYIIG